jgi:glycosyltransferase involved in cell wall biosynthesis
MTKSAKLLLPAICKAIARLPGTPVNVKTVAVDLTAVPQSAENGLTITALRPLFRTLFEQEADWHWVILTSPATHELFATLDGLNVRRHQLATPPPPAIAFPVRPSLPSRALRGLANMLGLSNRQRDWWKGLFIERLHFGVLLRAWRKLHPLLDIPSRLREWTTDPLLTRLRVDMLFCPFGATHIRDTAVPTVALWNDVAYLRHPHLLRPAERAGRDNFFRQTLHTADRLVCFSDQTKAEILKVAKTAGRRVTAIPCQPLERLPHLARRIVDKTHAAWGLAAGRYLLYPAEFTEFNNHKLLLVAFGMFRSRHPDSNLKLVLAGTPTSLAQRRNSGSDARRLQWAAWQMGLGASVVVVELPTQEQLAALIHGCRALVFPFLDHGNPTHLFQAIESSKPILSADLPNLPDAVRNAAHFFDAKRPAAIATALEQIATDSQLEQELTQRSHREALTLGGPREVAEGLLAVFREVLESCQPESDGMDGLFADGWTGERFVVRCAPSKEARMLTLKLQAPHWVPRAYQTVQLLRNWRVAGKRYTIGPRQTLTIKRQVPPEGATLEFCVTPTLVPYILGIANDARRLGCLCTACSLTSAGKKTSLVSAPTASI